MTTAANVLDRPRIALAEAVMLGFAAYGAAFALFPSAMRAVPFELAFYGRARPEGLADPAAAQLLNLYASLIGAVMVGMFLGLFALVRRREAWAWRATIVALTGWFVSDAAGSLLTGFWQNAAMTVAFYALGLVALWTARPGGAA